MIWNRIKNALTQAQSKEEGSRLEITSETSVSGESFSASARRGAGEFQPARKVVTVLHGTLGEVSSLLETVGPEDLALALNDFLTLAFSRARDRGAHFERFSGNSFIAIWGGGLDSDHHGHGENPTSHLAEEAISASECALELREDFYSLNHARKNDGLKLLRISMGVHMGAALVAKLGAPGFSKLTCVGEAVQCARALDRLAANAGIDLLLSHDIWTVLEGRIPGKCAGESPLTPITGLTQLYSVSGGKMEALFENETPGFSGTRSLMIKRDKPKRWSINNGSQIVGPWAETEIAQRLFAQELDFDCECWEEGSGKSGRICDSGMFSGSQDEGANLWVYDGQTIHGPISPGFLRTALICGAIARSAYVCEDSTVKGWALLESAPKAVESKAA
ncbi:hypothetical protein WDW86_18205 [Bdellovibrionota bacterium FG-2]